MHAGATSLGVYPSEYASAFFNASVRRGFIWSGEQRPAKADIELLMPPGAPLEGFSPRWRVLGETDPVKEATITGLRSRRIMALVNLDDLPLDVYSLEVALLDREREQLKRTLSEFELLPTVL